MLLCNYCDYLRNTSNSSDLDFCKKFVCEFANYTFTDASFENLADYPCRVATGPMSKIPTD